MRSLRLDQPGGVFHLISRALNRQPLLEGDDERSHYLALLAEASRRTDARVLAYAIMSNHVHLVVRAGDEPLWRLVKRVHVGYANWKNHRAGRLGPVFADRFKAILVEQDPYLLELVRYVHLNPVRAGVVARPEESTWTSHRFYAGQAPAPEWLDAGFVLDQLAPDRAAARAAYLAFVDQGLGGGRSPVLSGDTWLETAREVARAFRTEARVSGPIVGTEAFVADVLGSMAKVPVPVALRKRADVRATRPPLDALVDLACEVAGVERVAFDERPKQRASTLARQLLARVWVQEYRGTQAEVAAHLKAPAAVVSRWYARSVEKAHEQESSYRELVERLPSIEQWVTVETQESTPRKARVRKTTYAVNLIDELKS